MPGRWGVQLGGEGLSADPPEGFVGVWADRRGVVVAGAAPGLRRAAVPALDGHPNCTAVWPRRRMTERLRLRVATAISESKYRVSWRPRTRRSSSQPPTDHGPDATQLAKQSNRSPWELTPIRGIPRGSMHRPLHASSEALKIRRSESANAGRLDGPQGGA
jgi:hypothetical protein